VGADAVREIYKWMGIVFLLGFALMYVEYRFAKKKKEGYTPIDRQRILGIFGLTIFFACLVGAVMWLSN
jgi:arginine exporter protein ArgO